MLHRQHRRRFAVWLGLTATAWGAMGAAQALPAGAAMNEIELLIDHVSKLTRARFRGGRFEVGPENAARFLRHELAAKRDQVSSAEEFIRQCATRSDDTGRAYEVLLPGGAALPAAEMLQDVLNRLRAKGP